MIDPALSESAGTSERDEAGDNGGGDGSNEENAEDRPRRRRRKTADRYTGESNDGLPSSARDLTACIQPNRKGQSERPSKLQTRQRAQHPIVADSST